MEVLELTFQRRNFLHPCSSGLHLFNPAWNERTKVRSIFKLKTSSRAIFSDNDQRTIIPIPATAMVTLVGGDIDKDAFVAIRYEGRVLLMWAEDLRCGGDLWGKVA
jgi:hypothetical protein